MRVSGLQFEAFGRVWADKAPRFLFWAGVLVLVLDSLVLAKWLGYISFPGEISPSYRLRLALKGQIEYYRSLSERYGVSSNPSVGERLAEMERAVARVRRVQQAYRVMISAAEVDEAVRTALRGSLTPQVEGVLASDPAIEEYRGEAELVVVKQASEAAVYPTDQGLRVEEETLRKLSNIPGLDIEPLYFRLTDGRLQAVTRSELLGKRLLLRRENQDLAAALRRTRQQVGEAELTGRGVIVEASDAPGGYLWVQIVHERDIREIVNALFAAGARGVQIGTERFGATSWVRCVGPVVVVDGQQVAANPITVLAVGDPERLRSSLKSIQEEFALTQKRLTVTPAESITLKPYRIPRA